MTITGPTPRRVTCGVTAVVSKRSGVRVLRVSARMIAFVIALPSRSRPARSRVTYGRAFRNVSSESTAGRSKRFVSRAVTARTAAPRTATTSLTFAPGLDVRARATAPVMYAFARFWGRRSNLVRSTITGSRATNAVRTAAVAAAELSPPTPTPAIRTRGGTSLLGGRGVVVVVVVVRVVVVVGTVVEVDVVVVVVGMVVVVVGTVVVVVVAVLVAVVAVDVDPVVVASVSATTTAENVPAQAKP